MEFDLAKTISFLERTPEVLNSLLLDLDSEWAHNNEGGESWSPYDIVGHFIHGEQTDWMPRLEIILTHGVKTPFEPSDRFAQFEKSRGKSLEILLNEFEVLRTQNLDRLKSKKLNKDDFLLKGVHPAFGEVTVAQLLSTWAVHDLNHLRQMARAMAKQYKKAVGPWAEYLPILNE
jgi:hypothetical protein